MPQTHDQLECLHLHVTWSHGHAFADRMHAMFMIIERSATEEPKERRSSLSQMLGRRTSIEDAYKRYAGYTVNGDGFHRENYIKQVEPKPKAP
ncbi:hypothetical protein Tcan_16311 [Toxocara canis]|uniref:Uncharacterized protein n=1 Tax=Toxocara canis TaxID=6265 RepID=A0A0B2W2I1_TOXCA|nr:hypothetical protein Tcan_16311 [Toxocara canis]